jgi:hypothetical protein
MVIWAFPVRLALTLTIISGELVPKATIVNPIINGDIPRKAEILEAPFTSASAPTIKKIKPIVKVTIIMIQIYICFYLRFDRFLN